MNPENSSSPRRASRIRKQPQKYGDFLNMSPLKRRLETLDDTSEDDEECIEEDNKVIEKPSALFSKDDVEGQDMYKFKSRCTKMDLQNKVKLAIGSPLTESPLKTPRKSFHRGSFGVPSNKAAEETPKHVKDILKKRIIRAVDTDSSDGDFSGSSSDDFQPDDSDKESSSSSSSDEEQRKPGEKAPVRQCRSTRAKPRDSEYVVTPDSYFMMHSNKKNKTSDHTLARLKNVNTNENFDKDVQLSQEHQNKISELTQSYEQLFDKWLYVLSENFNIIFYGIGSKKSFLQKFQNEKLQDCPCIVVNGFFPGLTMKSILETILVDLLENTTVPTNVGDVVSLIDIQLSEIGVDLYLIIHNIDGPMLRNAKAQAMLAGISQIRNVHTIATIDHINAPLLWDHSKLSKFNFTWWDVTTFQPYTEETSFENSLMSHKSGALQLSSLRSVYKSLTTNAKKIFNVIIQYQLDNHKQSHYQGFPLKELYVKCRELFLVSSDLALRDQLTEFIDHQLVKMKRTYDGGENLLVSIDNALLAQFMEQIDGRE